MGYQALLFCPDEKLARVISQVFNELDFAVDPVHEPFAAVKQLMAQRYDAVVVDCENEQNASLLFRSARNSSFNQSSLALALVEGQIGVAKAYRIGANLVLTKPINVEQAKGTLRIARGLLRKGADAATTAAGTNASAMAAKAGAGSTGTGTAVSANAELASTAPRRAGSSELGNASVAQSEATPAAVATSSSSATARATAAARLDTDLDQSSTENAARTPAQSGSAIDSARTPEITQVTSTMATVDHDAIKSAAKTEPSNSATTSAGAKSGAFASPTGAAAAAAPAKEVTATAPKENKAGETKPAQSTRATPAKALTPAVPTLAAASATLNAPSFGGLSQESAGGSGHTKKILIAAVVILALAALGYFSAGKPKFGTSRTPEPANTPQDSSKPSPTLKPMSSTVAEPPVGTTDMAGSASSDSTHPIANTDKPTAGFGDSGEIRIGGNAGSRSPNKVSDAGSIDALNSNSNNNSNAYSATKTSVAPIQVKARAAKSNSQAHDDEAAPSPATLALTSANDGNISNLMSPASFNLSKPSLTTLKISQGVSQGLLIKRVEPKYPQSALALHAQGAVHIEATINKEGSVINPKVVKGDPLLARAALDAVKQWRYKPYYLDGSPVEIQTEITINFKAN